MEEWATSGNGVSVVAGGAIYVVSVETLGDGVYAGGGSFDGTVNAFIPGLSGLLVGFVVANGFGLGLRRGMAEVSRGFDVELLVASPGRSDEFDFVETLLFLRPNLRIEPKKEREADVSSEDMTGEVVCDTCRIYEEVDVIVMEVSVIVVLTCL
jgi:hypothetical protein